MTPTDAATVLAWALGSGLLLGLVSVLTRSRYE